jgi:hypothetical protein
MRHMTFRLSVLALSLLVASAAPSTAAEQRHPAKELAGRTAGAPERCVQFRPGAQFRISDSDRHMLLYGSGKTIWANDLGNQCGFRWNDVLVTRSDGSFYCRGEIVRSVDNLSRIPGPACILNDFVPYKR